MARSFWETACQPNLGWFRPHSLSWMVQHSSWQLTDSYWHSKKSILARSAAAARSTKIFLNWTNPYQNPDENVVLSAKWKVHIWDRHRKGSSRLYTGTLKTLHLQRSNLVHCRCHSQPQATKLWRHVLHCILTTLQKTQISFWSFIIGFPRSRHTSESSHTHPKGHKP